MRARVKLRQLKQVNLFAKKYITFARANMAPLQQSRLLPSGCQKPGVLGLI
jgi:hypothetical protein